MTKESQKYSYKEYLNDWLSHEGPFNYPCPECTEKLYWEFDCPGWRDSAQNGRIMVCDGCGNTVRWECPCGYWYRANNRRGTQGYIFDKGPFVEMGKEPPWLGQFNKDFSET